jgi:hypothetical protein
MEKIRNFFKIPSKSYYFSSGTITPQQMFNELMENYMKCLRVIGANILHDSHNNLNIRFAFAIFYLTFLFVINIYDIYIFRDDLVRDVFCILTMSGEIQSYAKVYVFIFMKKNCTELKQEAENFFKSFENVNATEIFEVWMMRTAHIFASIIFLYIIAYILIVTYPIVFYLIFEERILHFGVEIPGLDWKYSWIAYSLNFFHQSSCLIIFVIASFPSIMINITYLMTSFAYFEVLSYLLKDLDEIIINNENGEKNKEITAQIKYITEMHLELIR